MRPHLYEFFQVCAETLVCPEPIVEIGAFQVAGQEAIANLRPLFPGKRYIGCDMQPGLGVDRIENIHELSFTSGEVGTFILADTLEHVANPIRAMEEITRCLAPNGVVIFTSTMHFPVHGYPNDYWRFTPQCFRSLAAGFSCAATIFCGPADFPHTVCAIAAKQDYDPAGIEAAVVRLRKIRTIAPLIVERRAAKIIQRLVAKLVSPSTSGPIATAGVRAGFERLNPAGWYLVSGQWISGWVADPGYAEIEILAGGQLIHRAVLNRAHRDIAIKLDLENVDAHIAFRDQVHLEGIGDYIGPLHMVATSTAGERQVLCVSAPGIILGSVIMETEFVPHSFDTKGIRDARSLAQSIVDENRTLVRPANLSQS